MSDDDDNRHDDNKVIPIKRKRPSGRTPEGMGNGPGHGGPAKGAGIPYGSLGYTENKHPGFHISQERNPNPLTREEKIRRSNEMANVIYEVATDPNQYGTTRIQAAGKLYEIYNGKPIERVIVDEQPIVHDVIDPAELSIEAREELRAALQANRDKGGGPVH